MMNKKELRKHLKRIAPSGGKATAKNQGIAYMRAIGRIGGRKGAAVRWGTPVHK